MKIPVKNLTDRVKVSVFDARKQEMLGCVKLNVGELVTICAKEGFLRKWYPLLPNNEKKAGKYVGGEILLELSLADDEVRRRTKNFSLNFILDSKRYINPHGIPPIPTISM